MLRRMAIPCLIAVTLLATGPLHAAAVELAASNQARQPVTVAKDASERVRQAAQVLANYLGQISGATFEVRAGDGLAGIAVGRAGDFPALNYQKLWDAQDPTRTEDYLLRSHAQGLHLIGASDLAVEHAVWDLLYRLGHRQFFPGPKWEVVPKVRDLAIDIDVREHPSYYSRRIWYGYGAGPWAKEHYTDWCARNRAVAGIVINSGHAYDGILSRNKAGFAKHPEYLGLVNGERRSTKFCISNAGLLQLVVDDALAQFAANPNLPSVSVDPSDGGGWCECDQCKAMGSISNRAVTLANAVAAAVEAKHPGKYVGMYAYNEHSPPPTIRVHPRVVINVATSFITGGWTVDQLLAGWQRQGATVGMREYYSVFTWDHDLPGQARGANTRYLKTTLPHFHAKGARFLSAESSDNWGSNGLGYYLAARMLWDVREADRTDALVADFLAKAFGTAREPMAEFYRLTDTTNRPLLSDDLVGRLYRLLAEARKKTEDVQVHARLADLTLYVRYVELWQDYTTARGDDRQKAFDALVAHAERMKPTMMIHTLALVRDQPNRDKSITLDKAAQLNIRKDKSAGSSFTAEEIEAIVKNGIATRKLLDFTPVAFSNNLAPVGPLKLADVPTGSLGYSRGVRTYFTWVDQAPAMFPLTVRAGVIYADRGPASIELHAQAEAEGKTVDQAAAAPDKQEHAIVLKSRFTGLHHVTVSDRMAGTAVTWPAGTRMTIQSSPDQPASFAGRWSLYFYVPKGTQIVGGYASGDGTLLNGSGKLVHRFDSKPTYFSVPVPAGEDGKLWQFKNSAGQRLLMTVPPYLARDTKELLLPVEVIERDSK